MKCWNEYLKTQLENDAEMWWDNLRRRDFESLFVLQPECQVAFEKWVAEA